MLNMWKSGYKMSFAGRSGKKISWYDKPQHYVFFWQILCVAAQQSSLTNSVGSNTLQNESLEYIFLVTE